MNDTDALIGEYHALRPLYANFTDRLSALIRTLIETQGIEYFSIEPRTKEVESFEEKIQREDKSGKYTSCNDVTDLTGIRIIAYLQEDCDRISSTIRDHFEIDEINSSVKEEELDPDKFGYLSTHFVVSLPNNRLQLLEFSQFSGLKAEIQVRTLLQHTWATIDWKFRYKEERESPKVIRRRLFRISALLEAADNEFSAVKQQLDELRQEYSEGVKQGKLEISLNSESVKTFVNESATAKTIIASAKQAGITVNPATTLSMYARLSGTAEIMGIRTLDELNTKLEITIKNLDDFFEKLENEASKYRKSGKATLVEPAVLRYALMINTTAAQRKAIHSAYKPSEGYAEALSDYVRGHQ